MAFTLSTMVGAAQQKTSPTNFQKSMDSVFRVIKAAKAVQLPAELSKKMNTAVEKIMEGQVTGTKKTLNEQAAQSERTYRTWPKQNNMNSGDWNLVANLQGIPDPISEPPAASRIDVDARYKPYYDKMDRNKMQLRDIATKHNLYQKVYDKEGEQGLTKRAMAESDKSAVIRQMGGTQQLMNMTDAERKVAAEKMKKNLQQDPSILNPGGGDAGMRDIQYKLMNDKAYAEKFRKMSEAEKQVEMKKYMTIKPATGVANRDYSQMEKPSFEVDELLLRTSKRMQEITDVYNSMLSLTNETIENMHSNIRKWLEATANSIPVVELGEVGHDKDPEQMRALQQTSRMAFYQLAKIEMAMRAISWQHYRTGSKAAVGELDQFVGNFKWGQGKESQMFNGTYDEPKVATAISGSYDHMLQVAKIAEKITSNAKGAQKQFEEPL
jgi:hypothetical protein